MLAAFRIVRSGAEGLCCVNSYTTVSQEASKYEPEAPASESPFSHGTGRGPPPNDSLADATGLYRYCHGCLRTKPHVAEGDARPHGEAPRRAEYKPVAPARDGIGRSTREVHGRFDVWGDPPSLARRAGTPRLTTPIQEIRDSGGIGHRASPKMPVFQSVGSAGAKGSSPQPVRTAQHQDSGVGLASGGLFLLQLSSERRRGPLSGRSGG